MTGFDNARSGKVIRLNTKLVALCIKKNNLHGDKTAMHIDLFTHEYYTVSKQWP
jgi:hypothetical protein